MGGSSTINNCLVLESSKLSKLVIKKGLKTDAVEVEWLEEEDRARG